MRQQEGAFIPPEVDPHRPDYRVNPEV